MKDSELTYEIIGAAMEVHKKLGGPGLLESVYEAALCHELSVRGIQYQRQIALPIIYKGSKIKEPLLIDVLVEQKIILELKATEKNNLIFRSQLLTYLRLANIHLGLLINFGQYPLKSGISRVINGFNNGSC